MRYRSTKGTIINIPDGLTPKQIAAIKSDADAGYGTRAQQTADALGAKLTSAPTTPTAAPAPTRPPATQSGPVRDPAKITRYQEAVNRIKTLTPGTPEYQRNFEIIKSIGTEYGFQWQDKGVEVTQVPPTQAPTPATQNPETPSPTAVAAADGATGQPTTVPTATIPPTPVPSKTPTEQPPKLSDAINPDGSINPDAAGGELADARERDEDAQFKLDHPDETDQYGNTITYSRNPDGSVKRTVVQGSAAKAFTDAAIAALGAFRPDADRKSAEDATYATLTKYYDRDMARELEEQKQELANRGIPYDPAAAQDPNSKSLYGRTIGGINEKYRGLKDTAAQQAVVSGNQSYATSSAARDSFLRSVMAGADTFGADYGNYVNTIRSTLGEDTKYLLSLTAEQIATLKGISVQEAASLRDNALRERAQAETERANRAGEALQEEGLSQEQAEAAIDAEIKRRGLSIQEADSLRNDKTARRGILLDYKAKMAAINKPSGGGGSGASSGGGGAGFDLQ